MMTKPWQEIVAHYEDLQGKRQSIRALGTPARRTSESRLGKGLFAWTSVVDLRIVQTR